MKFDRINIENLIDSGNIFMANKLINYYLKKENKSLESRLTVAQFFFQLHDFKTALKYISIKELMESTVYLNKSLKEECLIFAARILNVLGAYRFAVQTLDELSAEAKIKYSYQIAGIYSTNNYFQNALEFYELFINKTKHEVYYHSYKPILARCYIGLGNYLEAEKLLYQYLAEVKQDTNMGRLAPVHSILGELYLNKKDLKMVLFHLELAIKMYESLPASNNSGYAQMWLAACYGLSRNYERSEIFFNLSWKLMYRKGIQSNIWLELYFWKGLVEFKKNGKINYYWSRILIYPEVSNEISSNFTLENSLKKRIQKNIDFPQILYISLVDLNISKLSNNLQIEYHFETIKDKFNCYPKSLTITLEIILIQAGPEGIPIYKACEILWPDQAASILSLIKRIEQIVVLINSQTQKIKTENNQLIYIDNTKILKWIKEPVDVSDMFLSKNNFFNRETVGSFFNISKSKSAQICKNWINSNMIIRNNSGKKTSYQKKM